MTAGIVFLFGLFIGSFLNVCIVRLPQDRSIVLPPSHCPRCGTPLRWYDNIPVLSFLFLRGKCRACAQPISWRYPAVELLNGLCAVSVLYAFGLGGEMALAMALCSALIVITFIDLDHQIIPDVITLPGMLLGLIAAPFVMTALAEPLPWFLERYLPFGALYPRALLQSVLGLLAGAAPLLGIGWFWEKFRNVEAMGGGDIKLMGMVGSMLGWKGALLAIMIGALSGSLVGGTLVLLKKHDPDTVIPFGPFLAAGSLAALFAGSEIIAWYTGFFRP